MYAEGTQLIKVLCPSRTPISGKRKLWMTYFSVITRLLWSIKLDKTFQGVLFKMPNHCVGCYGLCISPHTARRLTIENTKQAEGSQSKIRSKPKAHNRRYEASRRNELCGRYKILFSSCPFSGCQVSSLQTCWNVHPWAKVLGLYFCPCHIFKSNVRNATKIWHIAMWFGLSNFLVFILQCQSVTLQRVAKDEIG